MKGKCAVYRHFDKEGNLLYVGISNGFLARTAQHSTGAGWFYQIARIDVEWFDSREDALWEEDRAMAAENPKYNLNRPGRRGPKSRSDDVEVQRQAVLAEAAQLGIKLSGVWCLSVLQNALRKKKAAMSIDSASISR